MTAIDTVLQSLRRLRVGVLSSEFHLHQLVAHRLDTDDITFEYEKKLGRGRRVDFFALGHIAIEVKKGKPKTSPLLRQIERYCLHHDVEAAVALVERNISGCPDTIAGKPVYYISLSKLWGISL